MAFETNNKKDKIVEYLDYYEEEIVVDLELEIITTLDDLDNERRKCKKLTKRLNNTNDEI